MLVSELVIPPEHFNHHNTNKGKSSIYSAVLYMLGTILSI